MARKRMLDPSIWADDDFNNLSSEAKILFIGMISNADDEGRLPGNSLYLTSNILPYSGMTKERATKVRDEVLARMRSVVLYEVDGREYIQLKKWDDYQSINRPTPSKYPPLTEDSLSTHGRLTPNRIEENRIEKKRREENIESISGDILEKIALDYHVPMAFVQSKYEDMVNWHKSSGKTKKDWVATLRGFVKRDAIKIKQGGQNAKHSIDAREL